MKTTPIILILSLLFVKTIYGQCDKTDRDKIIFTSLSYFQDSINKSKTSIILLDSTQYSEYPNLSFEQDLVNSLRDTSSLANLLLGFKKTIKNKTHLTASKSCSRITLVTKEESKRQQRDIGGWSYYTTTEPFISDKYAIIYIENFCGSLCGSGYILYLSYKKDVNEWRVIYSKQTWVS